MNLEQNTTSSFLLQSNGPVKVWMRLVKCIIKTCPNTNNNKNLSLLQIISTSIGTGIPSPAMLLIYRPIKS